MESGERIHKVYLGLGSNIGDRRQLIADAVRLIDERVGQVLCQSSLIETEPWGFQSENKFLNGVILVATTLTPREVLKITQKIERELGRRKKTAAQQTSLHSPLSTLHYQDRPIDIDILLYDDLIVDEPDLKIPHPLMHQREFVMRPLKEIRDPHSL